MIIASLILAGITFSLMFVNKNKDFVPLFWKLFLNAFLVSGVLFFRREEIRLSILFLYTIGGFFIFTVLREYQNDVEK